MVFCCTLLISLFLRLAQTDGQAISPTITNSSGQYYIVSQSESDSFSTAEIKCNASQCVVVCDSAPFSCQHTVIEVATGTRNLRMYCIEQYSCNQLQLQSSATNSTSIFCMAHKACSFASFHLEDTNSFISIACISPNAPHRSNQDDKYACFQNSYYLGFDSHSDLDLDTLSSNDTDIFITQTVQTVFHCIGLGCYYLGSLYTQDEQLENTVFEIYSCGQCHDEGSWHPHCIYNYSIHCGQDTDLFHQGYCGSRECGCDELHHLWYHGISHCVNYSNITTSVTVTPSAANDVPHALISAVMGGFVICVLCGFALFCWRSRSEVTTKPYWQKKHKMKAKGTKSNDLCKTPKDAVRGAVYEESGYQRVATQSTTDLLKVSTDSLHAIVEEDESSTDLEDEDEEQEETEKKTAPTKKKLRIPASIFSQYHDQELHKKSRRSLLDEYSLDEIARHNTEESCWIIVNNVVLDVTKFLRYHPGDTESIVRYGGTNCDEHFAFHSPAGRQLFWKFVIGKVEGNATSSLTNCIVQ